MIDRRLLVLRMVASCGTVTGAAAALHYTPSAVSQQLRTLAKDLEVELVVQDGRRLRLTPAARTLLAHTDELFAHWERIRAELAAGAAGAGGGGGTLRLCGFSTAAAALLPPVATAVRRQRPGARAMIIEADPAECFDLLLADRADVAVVVATGEEPPSDDPRFEQRPLLEDPLDLLVPAGHPLAGQPGVALRELSDERWIMDRPGRPYHHLLTTACAAAGFTPVVAHRAAEWDTGAALVAEELGVALIPRLAHLPMGYAVARVPLLGDPAPSRQIVTAIRRGSAEHPLVALALATLDDLASPG